MKTDMLLLDTHVWIWYFEGDRNLAGSPLLEDIKSAISRSSLRISEISLWEVAMLESKGRISFSRDCLNWINRTLEVPGFSTVNISSEIACLSCRLPGVFHGDPADRLIAATAIHLGASLVTGDSKIVSYFNRNNYKVLEP
jgi:PIN domain nuclease of toxin-antitoxin system